MKNYFFYLIVTVFYSAAFAQQPTSNSSLTKGIAALENKRYQAALADFNEFIKSHPQNAEGYFQRAVLYATIANFNPAITDYTTVIH